MSSCVAHVSAAVRDIKFLPVTAGIKTVRASACRDETQLLESLSVDEKHAIGLHICYEEKFSVGGNAYVLGHAVRRAVLRSSLVHELHARDDLALHQIDLYQSAARELAGEERVGAIDGK